MRQHDRPADGAGERIAEAGGIRHPAVRSGVGEERGDVIPELRDRLAQRAAEADDERRDNDDPEQEDEEQALHRVGRGGRLDAADTHEHRHDKANDDDRETVVDRAVGSVLRGVGDGHEHRGDVRERSAQEDEREDDAQRAGFEAGVIEVRGSGERAAHLAVDDPHLVHREVGDDREEGDVAHLAEPVAETAAVVRAGSGEEYPRAHKRGDVGHNEHRPFDRRGQQAPARGFFLVLNGDINGHAQKEAHIERKGDPDSSRTQQN